MSGPHLEMSHERPRVTLRPDEVPSLDGSEQTDPDRDPSTGRFLPANGAARARAVKRAAEEQRLLGLDPTKVAPWMRPFVEHARGYANLLAGAAKSDALSALAGDCATAETVYRALLAAATSGEKIDRELLAEARGWLREHRTALATLSALARTASSSDRDAPDDVAEIEKRASEETERRREQERRALAEHAELDDDGGDNEVEP